MIKEFEILDVFPTLTEEELLDVNGGRHVCEGGGGMGSLGGIGDGFCGWKF